MIPTSETGDPEFHGAGMAPDAARRGLQHQGLRRTNARTVLGVVAFSPGVSNADISRLSGLAPQTVSAILTDLDRAGLISRGIALRGRRGQPATPIFLRAEGGFCLGCAIGPRHMDVVLLDMYAQILGHVRKDAGEDAAFARAHADPATLAAEIAEAGLELLAPLSRSQRARVVGIGVAAPPETAPGAPGTAWRDPGFLPAISGRMGLEAFLYEAGSAACWAEMAGNAGGRPSDFIYLHISDHVAAGLMRRGDLWEGPSGNSVNLGAMLVDEAAGFQTLHQIASLGALERRLGAAGTPLCAEADWSGLEPGLGGWIEAAAAALARVVFNTAVVTQIRMAVIDGAMPRPVLARLVTCISAHLERLPPSGLVAPEVRAGHCGALAPAMGAAELPLHRRYFSRALADIVG